MKMYLQHDFYTLLIDYAGPNYLETGRAEYHELYELEFWDSLGMETLSNLCLILIPPVLY